MARKLPSSVERYFGVIDLVAAVDIVEKTF